VYDLQAMLLGLEGLFQWQVLLLLCAGFLLGFVVGAIPGFNDANLMAIMLPFTLLIDVTGALVAMAALYAGAQAAGSIPAIILNIPGTPGNSASVIEGYALAQKGRAGYALGVSFAASSVGGFLGAVASIIVAPIIGNFALGFGPAEMFLVGAFGLTVVSSVTGSDLWKGLLVTVFGLLISLIGADSMTAFPRGTFGLPDLYDGLPLIPVLLGLFGLSELLFLMNRGSVVDGQVHGTGSMTEIVEGVRDSLRYRFTWLMSTVVGTVIGIIPGAGATIGSFVAYGQARQWSREKEKFGTGHAEGLVATDAANNAVAAGAVVPLLTIGLPGSASTTVMLAALFLHGVQPGPQLFRNFQVEAYTVLFSLLAAALLIAVFGIPLARLLRGVTFIPSRYLVALVGVLLFAGAFAWRFNPFDILLMIVFGVLGALMRVYNYSIPAFLLAIILGPLMESNFLRATSIGGYGVFFESAISQVLVALTALALAGPLVSMVWQRRGQGDAEEAQKA
jgi:putative tricarboxylic transport membrane protein